MSNTYNLALRLDSLNAAKKQIETEIEKIKSELTLAFPEVKDGISPPYFTVSLMNTVKIEDQAKAGAFYMKHKDLRPFFKLSCTKEHFETMQYPSFAKLSTSVVIKVDQKALKTVTVTDTKAA